MYFILSFLSFLLGLNFCFLFYFSLLQVLIVFVFQSSSYWAHQQLFSVCPVIMPPSHQYRRQMIVMMIMIVNQRGTFVLGIPFTNLYNVVVGVEIFFHSVFGFLKLRKHLREIKNWNHSLMPMRKMFPSSFIQYSKILDVPLSQRSLKLFFLFSNTTFVTLIYHYSQRYLQINR